MKIGKGVWEKKVSNEEKEAIKKALIKRKDQFEKIGENLELLEDMDSQTRDTITSFNKSELEEKIGKFEDEIFLLEKEIVKLRKDAFNSNTNKEYEKKLKEVQDKLEIIEKNKKKINETKEEIKKLKNDLMIAGKIVPGVKAGQENLN